MKGRQEKGLPHCLPEGWGLSPLSPAECLTSQSLQTSSKVLKACWKWKQNQRKRDCTVPAPFPSVGTESTDPKAWSGALACDPSKHTQRPNSRAANTLGKYKNAWLSLFQLPCGLSGWIFYCPDSTLIPGPEEKAQ